MSGRRAADFMLGGISKNIVGSSRVCADSIEGLVISDDFRRLDYGFPLVTEHPSVIILSGIEEHIRTYPMRKLGNDEGFLRAFQGVISLYRLSNIRFFPGIPFWIGDITGGRIAAKIAFALSICSWYHHRDDELQMFVSEQCHRRTHLPSWT